MTNTNNGWHKDFSDKVRKIFKDLPASSASRVVTELVEKEIKQAQIDVLEGLSLESPEAYWAIKNKLKELNNERGNE